jgi:hypothetical protein
MVLPEIGHDLEKLPLACRIANQLRGEHLLPEPITSVVDRLEPGAVGRGHRVRRIVVQPVFASHESQEEILRGVHGGEVGSGSDLHREQREDRVSASVGNPIRCELFA